MLEAFDVQFKESIKYGMTYDQFWFCDPQLYYIYEEAYKEQMEYRYKEKDIFNWQLGQYIQLAVGSCLSKECKFPERPMFSIEQKKLSLMEKFQVMMSNVNKSFE